MTRALLAILVAVSLFAARTARADDELPPLPPPSDAPALPQGDAPPAAGTTPPPSDPPPAPPPAAPSVAPAALAPAAPDRAPPRPARAAPKNAISLQLLSLLSSGITLQYERALAPKLSVVGALGYRRSGGDAFDVNEGSLSVEGRYFFFGKDGLSRFDGPAMVGPFAGFRVESGLTRVSEGGRSLGGAVRIAESIHLGARAAIGGRFEITPSLGIGLRHEIDPSGRLAAWTRLEVLRFGIAVGVLF